MARLGGRRAEHDLTEMLFFAPVASEKLDPRGFIGGFDRMTIVCVVFMAT
jgi:hypothetical protein